MRSIIQKKLFSTIMILRNIPKQGIRSTINSLIKGLVCTFKSSNIMKETKRHLDFEFRIVEHCNLNCSGCYTFAPLAKEKYMSVESINNDLLRLKNLSPKNNLIKVITLSGGEPLLHPDLIKIISMVRFHFPELSFLQLITNGILLKQMNNTFWEVVKKNNLQILVTKYPNINYEEIFDYAKDNGYILKYLANNSNEKQKFWKYNINFTGTINIKKQFARCYLGNRCTEISAGKFYSCIFPAHVHNFNTYFNQNIPVTEKDYFDIYRAKNIKQILQFASKPMPICRYCNCQFIHGGDMAWSKSKKEMSEWVE